MIVLALESGPPTEPAGLFAGFRKVILGARPASPSTPLIQETSIGAFVLPNAVIPDETPFESFKVPGENPRLPHQAFDEKGAEYRLIRDRIACSRRCRTGSWAISL